MERRINAAGLNMFLKINIFFGHRNIKDQKENLRRKDPLVWVKLSFV